MKLIRGLVLAVGLLGLIVAPVSANSASGSAKIGDTGAITVSGVSWSSATAALDVSPVRHHALYQVKLEIFGTVLADPFDPTAIPDASCTVIDQGPHLECSLPPESGTVRASFVVLAGGRVDYTLSLEPTA
jgi:hypothetical protein